MLHTPRFHVASQVWSHGGEILELTPLLAPAGRTQREQREDAGKRRTCCGRSMLVCEGTMVALVNRIRQKRLQLAVLETKEGTPGEREQKADYDVLLSLVGAESCAG
jgi:hypothetical protein